MWYWIIILFHDRAAWGTQKIILINKEVGELDKGKQIERDSALKFCLSSCITLKSRPTEEEHHIETCQSWLKQLRDAALSIILLADRHGQRHIRPKTWQMQNIVSFYLLTYMTVYVFYACSEFPIRWAKSYIFSCI